jgi:glycine/D-amino acid oxidase-like deaminating enzyme
MTSAASARPVPDRPADDDASTPGTQTPDVVIIGGGIMGAATALHLLREEPGLNVIIAEPDQGYSAAATPRASGGVRQLFSLPENIAMSQYTLQVIEGWREFAGEGAPDLGWRRNGYLFIGAEAETLQANLEVQLAHNVRAQWLDPGAVAARFPCLAVCDLAGAVFSPDDGWLDPSALLTGMLVAATQRRAAIVRDHVADFEVDGTRVTAVKLRSGHRIRADIVINTAGCWAPGLAAQVGMAMPVEPMRRFEHQIEGALDATDLPFIKDPCGLAMRPQGLGLSVGLVDFGQPGGFDLDIDTGYFERAVWPALAHRIPQLDELHLRATTTGLYDQNRLDGNMIIGRWPGHLDNFYLACGFSGHGMMHAPAVGRALSELVLHGEFRTIDLSRMGYQRVLDARPYPERGTR